MANKRKCKNCGELVKKFIVIKMSAYCTFESAIQWANKNKEIGRKVIHKQRKRELKDNDKPYRAKCAQSAFNAFIRWRDRNLNCISCDRSHTGQYHAGHYRSVGAHPELRFEESNCHKQCSACNNHLSGNISDYRINLIKKIGLDRVEWIEGPHEPKKYTCAEFKEIETFYKNKLKMLQSDTDTNGK